MSKLLWVLQVALAVVFVFSGVVKLMMSPAELQAAMALPMPVWFVKLVSVCEILGAAGLVLPGLFRTRTQLVPLAAACLALLMVGATAVTVVSMGVGPALMPLALGLVAAFVAYGRQTVVPLTERGGDLRAVRPAR